MDTTTGVDEVLRGLAGVVGARNCVTDDTSMAVYLEDWNKVFRGRAAAVVKPADTGQVSQVVRLCAEAGVAMVPQGGNTGLAGGATPDDTGRQIVISLERMRSVRDVDAANATLTVDAGCTLVQAQQAATAAGLYLPLSLGAEGSCHIGGNLSTNAGGVAVLHYGNARSLTLGLEVVLPDGRLWNGLRRLRKCNVGYDLKQLFIGAEGTLGIITAAVLKLFPEPLDRAVAIVRSADLPSLVKLLAFVRSETDDRVTGFEYLSGAALRLCAALTGVQSVPFPDCEHAALVELSGGARGAGLSALLEETLGQALEQGIIEDAVVASGGVQIAELWQLRESRLMQALERAGADISCDVSVPVSQVPAFIAAGTAVAERCCNGVRVVPYGHVGDGNIHFDLVSPPGVDAADFMTQLEPLTEAVYAVALGLGGSFSAEHGIGRLKVKDMRRYLDGVELDLLRTVKRALDPHGLMNPGKVVPDAV